MASSSPSLPLITQASSVFLELQPSSSELAALSLLVDQGVESLPQVLIQISQSAERGLGYTDELARLFFILFDRAPDLSTYTFAMNLLASGNYSMANVCQLGLQLNTSLLSNSLNLSNSQFVNKLANLMFTSPSSVDGLPGEIQYLIGQLDNSFMTRSQLLSQVLSYDSTSLKYHYEIEPALDYLAVTGLPPSQAQLVAAQGVSEQTLLRQVMTSSGVSPYGTSPYFSEQHNVLTISGNFAQSLSIDMSTKTSMLGANSSYRLFLSTDGGDTDSSVVFTPAILSGIQKIDASALGANVTSFSFKAGAGGFNVQAPNVPSTLTGGVGPDILSAGNATTTLVAGSGNETLIGGSGTDTFYAGQGLTTMTAGSGADTFVLPSISVFSQFNAMSTINGFGSGTDVLDLALLVGNTGAAKAATATVGSSALGSGFVNTAAAVNGSVFLVFDTGQWVNYSTVSFNTRTATDISNLFYTATPSQNGVVGPDGLGPVVFAKPPTVGAVYFVIDYNAFNGGADIWYVNNLAPLTTVTQSEITLVGHLAPTGNLWQALNAAGAITL